jgi:hypothetical protein
MVRKPFIREGNRGNESHFIRLTSRSTGVNGSNASRSIRSTTRIHCGDRIGTQVNDGACARNLNSI